MDMVSLTKQDLATAVTFESLGLYSSQGKKRILLILGLLFCILQ